MIEQYFFILPEHVIAGFTLVNNTGFVQHITFNLKATLSNFYNIPIFTRILIKQLRGNLSTENGSFVNISERQQFQKKIIKNLIKAKNAVKNNV